LTDGCRSQTEAAGNFAHDSHDLVVCNQFCYGTGGFGRIAFVILYDQPDFASVNATAAVNLVECQFDPFPCCFAKICFWPG